MKHNLSDIKYIQDPEITWFKIPKEYFYVTDKITTKYCISSFRITKSTSGGMLTLF